MAMVNMDNYEEFMMLYADKELNTAEEQALLAFVEEHPELKTELNAYLSTQLYADTTIVFEDKEILLKKPAKGIVLLHNWKFYAAAACALILLGTFFYPSNDITINQSPIAQAPTTITPEKPINITPTEQPQKELYSKQPVKTIAMETIKKTESKKAPLKKPVHHQQEEALVLNTSNSSANFEVITQSLAVNTVPTPNVKTIVFEDEQVPDSKLIMNTPIQDVSKGWQQIETIFNDKLIAAKQVKEKIEDTEVRFVIGKKQLFSVRL